MTNPAWTHTAGVESYGGHPNKVNHMNQGKIDALTDVGADDLNRIALDLAAVARTAPFLVARLTLSDTSPDDPTVHFCAFQPTGVSSTDFAGDAPPAGFPTFTRVGDGYVRVTFAASYDDDYGNSATTVLADAEGAGAGSVFANVNGSVPTALTAEFRVFDTGGTALNDQTIHVEVYT